MHHPDHVRGKTFLVTFSYVTTPYNKKFTPGPFKKRYLTFGLFVTRFLIKRPHSIEKILRFTEGFLSKANLLFMYPIQ